MKSLIVFYSRTGRTKKIAEAIQASLNGEIDEIHDKTSRSGIIGWLKAGKDAREKSLTALKNVEKNPLDYYVVVIGSPTWNGTVSTPIRTYIEQYKTSLKNVAIFSTGDGKEPVAIEEIDKVLQKKAIAKMHLVRKQEVETDNFQDKVDNFVKKIKIFKQE
jgi:flavodoxin